jgi:hypothetical protein
MTQIIKFSGIDKQEIYHIWSAFDHLGMSLLSLNYNLKGGTQQHSIFAAIRKTSTEHATGEGIGVRDPPGARKHAERTPNR